MLRNRRKTLLTKTRIILVISVFLIVFFSFGIVKEMVNKHRVGKHIADLQGNIEKLEADNSELQSLINTWSESSQLEREARLKLNMQKEGENAVLILREGEDRFPNENFVEPEKEKSNPRKWWIYFFGH